jgi:hypothetical protein
LPNISRAGRRVEAACHDTEDAEKDGGSALAVSILPRIVKRVKGEEMVSSSIGENGPRLNAGWATYSLTKAILVTAIGFSRLPKHEEPRLIRAVADEVIEQVS